MKKIKVKITSRVASEYQQRDVFRFAHEAGTVELTRAQARELLSDAVYNEEEERMNTDRHGGWGSNSMAAAYRALAVQLTAKLGGAA